MAEENDNSTQEETIGSGFPAGRVKRIVKLDKDVNKVTSEALFLISRSTELFIRFLAEKSAEIALTKKRKTIKLDYIYTAVKKHQPTSDFLLDELPAPAESSEKSVAEKTRQKQVADKPAPPNTRRIDQFFPKSANEADK